MRPSHDPEADARPCLIGTADAGLSDTDPGFWRAGLYVLGDGTYLLAGSGGPASDFAAAPGERGKIRQLDDTEAFNWAATHLSISCVEEWFDHLIEEI